MNTLFDASDMSSTPPPSPSRTFYKIYRIEPPRRFATGATLVEGSVCFTDCPDAAIAEFKRQLERCETGGLTGKSCTDTVLLSVQRDDNIRTRGRIIYKSNSGGKVGRSRISPNDPRVILPATKDYGEIVAKTWGWHPRYINGLEDCVASGSITRGQADAMLALRPHEEIVAARKALEKLQEKNARRARKDAAVFGLSMAA